MSGRFVWIEEHWLDLADFRDLVVFRMAQAPPDAVAAFQAAVQDRLGDAESAVETIALGLRALGRPYPLADWPQPKPPPYPADDEGEA